MKEHGATNGLEPFEIKQLQDDHKLGIGIETLALRYDLSRRTITRYLAMHVERVYVDGWTAWFGLRGEKKSPQRLTPWELA